MVDLIITGIVSILSIVLCCGYLKIDSIKEQKSISGILPRNIKQTAFGIGLIISILSLFLVFTFLYDVTWAFAIKRIILSAVLWPVAFIDYRKHIIQNKVLLSLLILRIVIAIVEVFCDVKSAKLESLSCLIAGVGILAILCVMRLIVRDGIGFGDIKLFVIIGLYLGVRGAIPTIFLSFVVSFFISIFMLATKKKNKKDYLAFAPSILIGTLLSTIFIGA